MAHNAHDAHIQQNIFIYIICLISKNYEMTVGFLPPPTLFFFFFARYIFLMTIEVNEEHFFLTDQSRGMTS